MKKLVTLLAVLSMFFAACSTDTTIDTASTAQTDDANSADPGTDGDDTTSDADADDSADIATPDPEPTSAPTTAPAETPTSAAANRSSAATVDQAAALQAVVDADDWCQAASVVEEGTDALDAIDFTDPAAIEQGFKQAAVLIRASQRLAPPEIAADVEQTIDAMAVLTAALEDAEWSFIDLDLAVIEQFDAPMQLASYNIEKYNFEACAIGTDPGEPPTEADLFTPDDDFEFDGTIRDQAVQSLVAAGFTEDEAGCLFTKLDFTDPEAMSDTTALFSIFTDCGISIDRLAQLGG